MPTTRADVKAFAKELQDLCNKYRFDIDHADGGILEFNMRQSHELQEFITKIHDDAPVFEHKSVWDFYEAIGYDRKGKRFTR